MKTPMGEKMTARREGHPDTQLTLDEYWALPEPAQSATLLLDVDEWARPNRIGTDEDFGFPNKPKPLPGAGGQ
jgi:hypothetical protein